jgi:peptide/nickel transport system permease protein
VLLAVFYGAALLAPFLAPYSMERQNRDHFFEPPARIVFRDAAGRATLRPHVVPLRLADPGRIRYEPVPGEARPVRFLARGERWSLPGGAGSDRHLFGVDEPGRIFLLGTDAFGRDLFSRLLFGARVSLSVGLLGILISYVLGLLVGGISGYLGGATDTLVMRGTEILMSIPGLYLILALRAAFPLTMRSDRMYLVIVGILSLLGWAALARVIRGMVLSIRAHDYVAAAEALGASRLRVLLRHILPNTMSFVIVAATVAVPGFILGEVALSFLGVGIQEPAASWGNMLKEAQNLRSLVSFPWVLAPGYCIFLTVLAFNFLGDGLRDALDPRTAGR